MEKVLDSSENSGLEMLFIKKEEVERTIHNAQIDEGSVPEKRLLTLPQVPQQRARRRFFKKKQKKPPRDIDHLIAEQFKSLKIRILHRQNGNLPRTILIASAFPSEGKSTVSTNLAISLAKGVNEHALLVDCDLRKPEIHKIFGLAPEKGLADYLSGNEDLPKILLKTKIPKLTLLPVGKIPSNPVDLIASQKMEQLIQELKTRYKDRYIIFDSSPIQLTSEPMVLLKQVEGIILVVKACKTNKEVVLRIIKDIDREKLLGIVLNGFKKSLITDYYYSYKYSYKYY